MRIKDVLKNLKKEEGFALVEVAIALIVMGIMLGVGLPSFLHYLQWQKIRETKEKQEKIFYSVASFVLQNGFIPLPADPYEKGDSFGLSRPTADTSSDLRGIIPFKTLGLPEDYARDGFNHYFTYIGGAPQKGIIDLSNQASFCQVSPLYGIEVDEHRPEGGYVKRSADMAAQNPIVLIILSHGESGYGAYYGMAGSIKQLKGHIPGGVDKRQNASLSLRVISRASSKKPQDFFDDMVMWVTRENLMAFYAKSPCQSYEKQSEYGYSFI
jgi:type II secretory pathway pseudopilin PulG